MNGLKLTFNNNLIATLTEILSVCVTLCIINGNCSRILIYLLDNENKSSVQLIKIVFDTNIIL